MNIWITGCAGFLGQRLAQALHAAGANVVGISRRASNYVGKSVVVDLASRSSVEIVRETASIVGAPDVVIHASSKKPSAGTLQDFVRANVHSSFNLLEGLKPFPPTQVIYTSTLSVYPAGTISPVNETAPAVAAHPYAATKRWAEEVMQCWKESQVTVLRLPSLYGKGQADSFIDGLARLAINHEPIELFLRGEVVRDALHVSDVVSAIRNCIGNRPNSQFCVMNLGCGRPISTMEYAEALVNELGSSSKLIKSERKPSQTDMWADITVARRTIGFQPTELRQSMKTYGNELRS